MKDIVIIGSGGFGREVQWMIEDINRVSLQWNFLGFVDDLNIGQLVNGSKVLGNIDWLKEQELYAVCAIADPSTRKRVINKLKQSSITFPVLLHPSVIASSLIEIGEGTIVCAGSILTVDIKIGKHVIVNLDSTVGHDASIGDYCTILPSVNISGHVVLEERVSVGTGSQIIQGIKVDRNVIIGAGAVVVKDIPSNVVAVGSPAKPIKEIIDKGD